MLLPQRIEAIGRLMGARPARAFLRDRRARLAVERLLEIIGEAATRVPDFEREKIALPWTRIVGLRNRLVHAYDDTDPATLEDIVATEIPRLAEVPDAVLEAEPRKE